jgi:hypothetical protein
VDIPSEGGAVKPHEEEWIVHPLDSRAVVKRDAANAEEDGLVVADVRRPLHEDGREVAALIAAAPDMARALVVLAERRCENLLSLESECARLWQDTKEWCPVCRARAALTKAGVLP